MPRRKIRLDDPHDPQKIAEYIEAKARQANSKKILALLNDESKSIILSPILRARGVNSSFEILTYAQKVASAAHLRAEVAEDPCNNCQQGYGPFADCARLSDYSDLTRTCCTNCQFDLNTSKNHSPNGICSFAAERPHISRIVRNEPLHRTGPASIESHHSPVKPSLHLENGPRLDNISECDSIHILGNLVLPIPSSNMHGEEILSMLKAILPHIELLEKRDMKLLEKSILDLDRTFEEFKVAEVQSWIESGCQPQPPEFLVKPSGSLNSNISHRLNQPSFTTNFQENGETADPTNGCISMVMNTAFNRGSTLIYDQLHRRSTDSEGLKDYPPQVLQIHEELTRRISESSEAKVEIVYGKKAQQAILGNPEIKLTPLPLWNEYSGIIIHLVHESSFRNAQEGHMFRRAIVFAHHPQRLFHDIIGGPFVVHQEKSIAVAASMARIKHISNYYQHKLWNKVGLSSHRRHEYMILSQSKNNLLDPTLKCKDNLDPTSSTQGSIVQDENWETFFNANPHSNAMLAELIPEAIRAAMKPVDQNWIHPSSMPTPVLNWWKGQKQILFYDTTVSGLDDIVSVLDKSQQLKLPPNLTETINRTSLQQVLGRLMQIQKYHLEHSNSHALKYRWVKVIHSRFDGRSIPVKCSICQRSTYDKRNATFSVNRPNHLIIPRNHCQMCRKVTDFIPTDDSMPFVNTGTALLSTAPKIVQRETYRDMLRLAEDLTPQQTQPVESFCIRCREKTLLSDGNQVYVDKQPVWTVGNIRPFYVERRPTCLNCKRSGEPTGRFVPINQEIPSIYNQSLSALAKLYRGYDESIKASLMDHWPTSNTVMNLGKRKRLEE